MGIVVEMLELPVRDLEKLCRIKLESGQLQARARDALDQVLAEESALDHVERAHKLVESGARRRELTRLRVQKHRRKKAARESD